MTAFLRAQIDLRLSSIMIFIWALMQNFHLFLDQWLRKDNLLFHRLYRLLRLGIRAAVLKSVLSLLRGPRRIMVVVPRLTLGGLRLHGG